MKGILTIVVPILLFLISCKNESKTSTENNTSKNDKVNTQEDNTSSVEVSIKTIKHEQLLDYLSNSPSEYTIVNFWATWCVPCVKELPHFFEIKNANTYPNIEWVFVSLDEAKVVDTKVKEFLLSKKYTNATHYLLDDKGREQVWIDLVNKNWEGSIPATAFYKNGKQVDFYEGVFNQEELNDFILKNRK